MANNKDTPALYSTSCKYVIRAKVVVQFFLPFIAFPLSLFGSFNLIHLIISVIPFNIPYALSSTIIGLEGDDIMGKYNDYYSAAVLRPSVGTP